MKILPVEAEFLNADRRTDMTNIIVVFRNFSREPKKCISYLHETLQNLHPNNHKHKVILLYGIYPQLSLIKYIHNVNGSFTKTGSYKTFKSKYKQTLSSTFFQCLLIACLVSLTRRTCLTCFSLLNSSIALSVRLTQY
jgi:hypothetical protein